MDDLSQVGENPLKQLPALKWKPLSLTLVEYPEGDFLGKILAICSLSPLIIGVGFCTLILFRRDLHTISYFLGLFLNELLNWVLKHVICEARPLKGRDVVTEYGMPSSHAQFIWFFATYLIFFIFIRVHHNHNALDNLWKYLISLGVLLLALAVIYCRVYLQYHTWHQVLWGSVIGFSSASVWFLIVQTLLTPLFPIIASWPFSEWLMLRDSTLIPNVMWFEYTSSRSEARARQRKLTSRKSQ